MKQTFLALLILLLFFPNLAWASTAWSSVESQVQAGNAEVYQSVETTVNGKTIKKESNQPGKLELKMEQTGNGSPTATFTERQITPTVSATPSAQVASQTSTSSFAPSLVEFVRKLLSNLASWFK